MPTSGNATSSLALKRKLRALAAVLADPSTTEHERANAERLKLGLEKQLGQETPPEGPWTGLMFRLGRDVRAAKETTSPPSPKGDWTDHAFRLGRMFRGGFKLKRPR